MDKILALFILAVSVFSFFIPALSKKRASRLWRLFYLVPLIAAAATASFAGWDIGYIGVYLAAVILTFALYLNDGKKIRIISIAACALVTASLVYMNVSPFYQKEDYAAYFDKGFNVMKEHYVLTEEKEIDWDALYAKYRPRFEDAASKQDNTQNIKYWLQFTQEFYDGHVDFSPAHEDEMTEARCGIFGNDYGLSLIKLSTGEYVAVNVEGSGASFNITEPGEDYDFLEDYLREDAEENRLQLTDAGLHNGSIITSWDGKSPEELEKEVDVYLMSYPDKTNEEFYRPMYAAGKGGESIEIRFLDDNGNEHSVNAKALGPYYPRLVSSLKTLDNGVNISNLEWKELGPDTAMMRIDSMAYDTKSYSGADYTAMTDEIRENILAYKEKGLKRLVIDLRRNGGGSPFMVKGVVCLFAPKGEHLLSYTTVINEKTASYERGADGKYTKGEAITYEGEDLLHDCEIILLVNAETVSAGDLICYLMSDYPNVTIMGFTGSNSSCQAVTAVSTGCGDISFSAVPNLDENAEPIIDSRADHVRRVPIDTIIPLTAEAVHAIYENGEDYLLDYAKNY